MAVSSIIDNRDGNTLCAALERMGAGGKELWIASAFFSLDALLLLVDTYLLPCWKVARRERR